MKTELTFKYEEILEEENLHLSDLPKEIRLSINALKPNYARYQKQPSDAMREALIQQDIAVSNSIYDWLDEQETEQERLKAEQEEKDKAEAEAKKKAEEEAAKAAAEEEAKKKAEEEAEAKKKEEPKYKFGTPEMVSAIKEKVDANGGNITIPELRAIIKKEPDYPYQEVYNIKLHKPYMKPFYKIV